MYKSPLGWNFFGLSSDYRTYLLDEYIFLARTLRMSYSDFRILPTYERKYIIDKVIEQNKKD
jgi:hypothetical protein